MTLIYMGNEQVYNFNAFKLNKGINSKIIIGYEYFSPRKRIQLSTVLNFNKDNFLTMVSMKNATCKKNKQERSQDRLENITLQNIFDGD